MATGDWLSRNRSHSADILELDSPESCSSRSTSSSPSRPGYTARSSLPSFTVTPPVSPTRGGRSSYGSTFHSSMVQDSVITNLSAKYGSLDRKGVANVIDNATTVKVYINLSQYKIGTHNNPCSLEALGIVPKRHSVSERSPFATLRPNRLKSILPIAVRGVVPSSPVALTGQLHPGDQIITVNGQMVNLKNIDSVLSFVTSEIIMEVLHYTKDIPPDHPFSPPPILSSDYEQTPPPVQLTTPPLVILLTLDTKEDDPPEADILYRYPFNDGGDPSLIKLTNLRGVVATLCDISSNHFQAASDDTCCCSFLLDNKLFFAFGKKFGVEIFLLTVPAIRTPPSRLALIYQTIFDSFVGLFGSIKSGLMSHDHDSTHLLSLIFNSMCPDASSNDSTTNFYLPISSLLSPIKLKIPTRTRALIGAQLNQLDSGVLRSRTRTSDTNPNPVPIGSCVFYKGYLVVSHLAPPLLKSVMTVCLINDLFELTVNKTAAQTIVWRQIHQATPTTNCIPGYDTYVVAMAMEQTIVCHVIDYLSDIDSAPPTICQSLRIILEQLHTNGLLSECEGCVLSQTPVLTTADVLLASLVSSTSSIKKTHMKRNSAGSLRSLSIATTASSGGTGSESDSNSDESGTGIKFYSPQKKKSSFKKMLSNSFRKSKSAQNFRERHCSLITLNRPPYMLVAGMENLLLYFMGLDIGRGVVICPCKEQLGLQPVQKDVLNSFKDVATSIHRILHKKYSPVSKSMSFDDDNDESDDGADTGGPFTTPGSTVREYGVLMECTIPSSVSFTAPKLLYWVIGRLFVEEDIELYVCFQENMAQVTVEMLFKLIFGTTSS